jgi:hypothetical protein
MNSEKILLVLAVLGGISEALSLIPSVKANGVFQLVYNALQALKPKKPE